MKHTLLTPAFVLLAMISGIAQNSVKFNVNMSNLAINPNGVHVAGNWQSEAGLPGDWEPNTALMTDDDMDGIYSYSCELPDGVYEFKYINGDAWGTDETQIPAICQVGGGNTNRFFVVDGSATELPAVGYNNSVVTDVGLSFKASRFTVEIPTSLTVDPTGVYVSGSFMDEFSNGIFTDWLDKIKLYDINSGDGIANYTGIIYYPETVIGTFNYSFYNGPTQELLPTACQAQTLPTRAFTLVASSELFTKFCFASCDESCITLPTYNATINIDMRYRCDFDINSNDSVDVAGTFNNYQGGAEYLLSDADNDGIYSITLPLQAGEFQYKARIITNGNFAGGWEPGSNTIVNLNANTNLAPRCFGQVSGTCAPIPDPSEITFRVEFQNETPADQVYVIGDFTTPPYQGGALLMNQVSANVFEVTTEICPGTINYKFVNGITSDQNNIESYVGITDFSCLNSNGIGGFNRFYIRQSSEPVLLSYIYNSCSIGVITGASEPNASMVKLYPNPTSNQLFIQSESLRVSQIQLIDLSGKVLLIEQNAAKIDCSSLSSGYYMIRYQLTDGSVHNSGVVIE
jgi:hypothetical protein